MSTNTDQRPTRAETDLENLAFNFKSVRKFIGEEVKYLAVVKANAYGHGAVECSKRLQAEGIDWFGVALPEEAFELRDHGIEKPILILGSFWPGQESEIVSRRLTPVIFNLHQASLLDAAARCAGVIADYHVKVDTGMGRIGVRHDQVFELAAGLADFKNLRLDGLMTHFAAADDLWENQFTEEQTRLFDSVVDVFADLGFMPTYIDLANSPGAIAHPETRRNMVRLGGVLYGLGGDVLPREIEKPELRAVLSLSTNITHLKHVPAGETLGYGRSFKTSRESLIATIPIGYADGYPRALSNIGKVLINGAMATIVGKISMDWTIVDVTEIPNVAIGDTVVLIGNSGPLTIRAEDLAARTGTISYEITCGVGARVTRSFAGETAT